MSDETEDRCKHVRELEGIMRKMGIDVRSEHGQEPFGWVNVHCRRCYRTFEIRLATGDEATP